MCAYRKGRQAEYEAREMFKKLGAKLVVRSAGSRGIADLIAFFPKQKKIFLVQVKKSKTKISNATLKVAAEKLIEFEGTYKVYGAILLEEKGKWRIDPLDAIIQRLAGKERPSS